MTANPAGGLLVVGVEGPALSAGERRILAGARPYGVILFARNVESPGQLAALVADLRRAAPGVLLFVDAEGGRVDRLRALVGPAPAGAALASAPPAAARRAGRWIGEALACFDLDATFAPVVDLDRGAVGNALDGRCLGKTPRAVAARGRAFLRGLAAAGVGGCLKHFPGLGGAREDTHLQGSAVALSRGELAVDLRPFQELGGEAGAVMVGHAAYPDPDPSGRPASLSARIGRDLLRGELGFAGAAFSDDLEMKALDVWGDLPERAAAALAAGCDALLICREIAAVPEVAGRLARPELALARAAAAERLAAYQERLAALRRGAWRRAGLEEVRWRLSALRASLGV